MQDRRHGERYVISFPVRVKWRDESGKEIVEDGLTENVGPQGALVFLPRPGVWRSGSRNSYLIEEIRPPPGAGAGKEGGAGRRAQRVCAVPACCGTCSSSTALRRSAGGSGPWARRKSWYF